MTEITFNQVYAIGLPIVLVMILLEVIISNIKNESFYNKEDTFCTVGLLVGNIFAVYAAKGLTLGIHFYVYQFRISDLIDYLPLWLIWLFTFILIDLVFYFYHRLSHRVRFLWAIHMSHHSSEEMNFAVSFRQAWFGPVSKIPFFIVLPLAGLDPTIIAIAGVISTLWGIVGHTQIIDKLGPLELVFNTPSHHRVHHGSNEEYIDKNFGNLLIIWDKIFGTFEPENDKVKYGLVKNVDTFNPVKITFMEWSKIFEDFIQAKSFRHASRVFFGPPTK